MSVFWLNKEEISFPHPSTANADGILAVGGDLKPERLVLAYNWGIFPWFNEGEPIVWWHPNPRFVLYPDHLKVSKSMRSTFNQKKFNYTFDHAFSSVISACQKTYRKGQKAGTWITTDMEAAYIHLHELGYAHSVEVWQNEELVGGLYGIALGRVFFGESMFSNVSNASKAGFITLVRTLKEKGYTLIDCQMGTKHLKSLGAESLSRDEFLQHLADNQTLPTKAQSWKDGPL